MRAKAGTRMAMLAMLARVAALLPTETRRSEESQALQQFSTPIPLGFVASVAAGLTPADFVLEPSAGTGLFGDLRRSSRATLALNELAPTRASLLERLFATAPVSRHDAEQIHDYLPGLGSAERHSDDPPFSASPNIEGRVATAAFKHLASALACWARVGGWSPSRARALPLTARRGAKRSPACRSAGGWCSRRL